MDLRPEGYGPLIMLIIDIFAIYLTDYRELEGYIYFTRLLYFPSIRAQNYVFQVRAGCYDLNQAVTSICRC